jgi:hypothetical protein
MTRAELCLLGCGAQAEEALHAAPSGPVKKVSTLEYFFLFLFFYFLFLISMLLEPPYMLLTDAAQ